MAAASMLVVIVAAVASRVLPADAAPAASLRLVLAAVSVGVVPGVLVVLVWRPRTSLTLLEVVGLGVAVSLAIVEALTIAAVLLHFSPVVSLVLLFVGAVGLAVLVLRRSSADAILVSGEELFLVAVMSLLGISLYVLGSPVSWWEDQAHVAVARRLSVLDAPRLDNLYFTPGVVYTYPFPGIHYFVALAARLGDLDPLFVYQKLRFFWGPAALTLLHLAARAVFGAGATAIAVSITAVLLVCNGAFAMVPGFSSGWGQLVPFSHVSDVAMTVVLPALLVAAFGYVLAEANRERWFFGIVTAALTLMLTIVHTREVVQFAMYAGCFLMATLVFRPLRTHVRRAIVLVALVLAIVPAYAAWQSSVASHVNSVVAEERQELVEIVEERSLGDLVQQPASAVLERFMPNSDLTFGGLFPLGLMAAPVLVVLFGRRPLMWLAMPSMALYLAIISLPLLAFGYVYVTYYEILYSPVRNVAPFAYLFVGALIYIAVMTLTHVDRTRLSLPLAGAVAGTIAVIGSASLNQSPRGFFLPLIVACIVAALVGGGAAMRASRRRLILCGVLGMFGAIALLPERKPVLPTSGVQVEWSAGLSEPDRTALERQFQLVEGERDTGPRESWHYRLTDVSQANVRSLVLHPQVAETGRIDRNSFLVEVDLPADEEDLFVGARLLTWLMYPGPWMFFGVALVAWGLMFLAPLWLASDRGRGVAAAIETAMGAPFRDRVVPYALFMVPLLVLTARPASSPLLATAGAAVASTPSAALAALPCLDLGRRPAPFAEDVAGGPPELPPVRVCLPGAAVTSWAREHLPADAVLAVNRWHPAFVPLVMPQQVAIFPGAEGALAEERTLYRRYYEFYTQRLEANGAQPFFNDVETPAQRAEFVSALGVTHVLVDPQTLGVMQPILDGLPELFTRLFAGDGWAVYEVRRSASAVSAGV